MAVKPGCFARIGRDPNLSPNEQLFEGVTLFVVVVRLPTPPDSTCTRQLRWDQPFSEGVARLEGGATWKAGEPNVKQAGSESRM